MEAASTYITPECLEALQPLRNLQVLRLSQTNLSRDPMDRDPLAIVAGQFPALRELKLQNFGMLSDAGLELLASSVTSLEVLWLEHSLMIYNQPEGWTYFTTAGLRHLSRLEALQQLHLESVEFEPAQLAQLEPVEFEPAQLAPTAHLEPSLQAVEALVRQLFAVREPLTVSLEVVSWSESDAGDAEDVTLYVNLDVSRASRAH